MVGPDIQEPVRKHADVLIGVFRKVECDGEAEILFEAPQIAA